MDIAVITKFGIAGFLLLFAGFCWVKQGSLVKGKGWLTRTEAPKMFWINMAVLIVIAIYMLYTGFVEIGD